VGDGDIGTLRAYVTAIARPMPESAPVFSAHSGQSFATFQVRSP